MDDFSTPGIANSDGVISSPYNFIQPGKRALSTMAPSIIVDGKGDVKMTIGAAGGPQIVTAISQVILKCLYLNESLNEAVQSRRLHHQLLPKVVSYEEGYDQDVLRYLVKNGHAIESFGNKSTSAVNAILIGNDNVEAVFDSRRGGSGVVV